MKEAVGLSRTRFLLGDFCEYLETTDERFDLVFASGVLYHMADPIGLIESVGRVATALLGKASDLFWVGGLTAKRRSRQSPAQHLMVTVTRSTLVARAETARTLSPLPRRFLDR